MPRISFLKKWLEGQAVENMSAMEAGKDSADESTGKWIGGEAEDNVAHERGMRMDVGRSAPRRGTRFPAGWFPITSGIGRMRRDSFRRDGFRRMGAGISCMTRMTDLKVRCWVAGSA